MERRNKELAREKSQKAKDFNFWSNSLLDLIFAAT
jgi:hypothetical protein